MTKPEILCPVCSSKVNLFRERCDAYDIYSCQSCTLEFSDPMIAMSAKEYELAEWENDLRLLGNTNPESVLWWGHKKFIKSVGKFLTPKVPVKLIDIGCGTGAFVDLSLKNAIDAYGVDFDETSLQIARNNPALRERVFCGDTKDICKCLGSSIYDVATAFEVLEHVDNINLFMSQINALLSPNGVVALCVPVANRWSLKFQAREPGDYPPHHLTRWTEKALRVLMQESGFTVLKIYESPVSLGLYKLVSRVFNGPIVTSAPVAVTTSSSVSFRAVNKLFECAFEIKQKLFTPLFSALGIKGDRILLIARKR